MNCNKAIALGDAREIFTFGLDATIKQYADK
jgi:hypothetical protein